MRHDPSNNACPRNADERNECCACEQRPLDFLVTDHGSLVVLTPMTEQSKAWVGEYLPPEAPRYGGGIVIESRYWRDIYHGITEEAGLTVG